MVNRKFKTERFREKTFEHGGFTFCLFFSKKFVLIDIPPSVPGAEDSFISLEIPNHMTCSPNKALAFTTDFIKKEVLRLWNKERKYEKKRKDRGKAPDRRKYQGRRRVA